MQIDVQITALGNILTKNKYKLNVYMWPFLVA
jgi:hypothetical protein